MGGSWDENNSNVRKEDYFVGVIFFCSEDSLFCFTVVQILEKGTKSMCNHGQLGERERERERGWLTWISLAYLDLYNLTQSFYQTTPSFGLAD